MCVSNVATRSSIRWALPLGSRPLYSSSCTYGMNATYDTFHPFADHTYRLGYTIQYKNGQSENYPASPAGWDNYIKDSYSGISGSPALRPPGCLRASQLRRLTRSCLTEDIIWAEGNFHSIIFIPLIKGNPNDPLKEVNSMLLCESAAKELFGNDDPINKMVNVSHMFMTNGQKATMLVSGVYKDFPTNTHLRPKYILNILALKPLLKIWKRCSMLPWPTAINKISGHSRFWFAMTKVKFHSSRKTCKNARMPLLKDLSLTLNSNPS